MRILRAEGDRGSMWWIFNCAKAKLVIEVDGGYHEEGMQKKSDVMREEKLRGMGWW